MDVGVVNLASMAWMALWQAPCIYKAHNKKVGELDVCVCEEREIIYNLIKWLL